MKRKEVTVPQHYIPKHLSRNMREKQKKELRKSRKMYKKKMYYTRKKIPTFKSRRSRHINVLKKIYKLKDEDMTFEEISKKSGCSIKSLNEIIGKGMGAYYSSGSRPNQTPHSWGVARLYSSLTGGPSSKYDRHILEEGCKKNSLALKLSNKPRTNTRRRKIKLGGKTRKHK